MRIQTIGFYPKFKSVTEEHRKPPVENEQLLPQNTKHKTNPVAATGWVGASAAAVSIISGIKHMRTLHKISAFTAIGSIALHIGLIKSYHHKHHKDI